MKKPPATKSDRKAEHTNGRASRIETAAVAGAVAGAAVGVIAGPIGIAAGAIAGTAAGAMAGVALADESDRRHANEAKLDREIGISEGDIGAAEPPTPSAR